MSARGNMLYDNAWKFALGGAAGVGLAMLLAPKASKEIRDKIGAFAGDILDDAEAYVKEQKERVITASEKGRDYLREKKTQITSPFEACMSAYAKEKERLSRAH